MTSHSNGASALSEQPDFDVLIVGAGISGIGAAYHLKHKRPQSSFAILEGRQSVGGTWDLFRFPGIRSDSDMPTFGFAFKPWTHVKAISPAEPIREYLNETVAENGIAEHIRFGHHVRSAAFSTATGRWTVSAERTDTGEIVELSARYLLSCTGYYDYSGGYMPEFPGAETYEGTLVHAQKWSEDIDYAGKRVVVIGSGATAVTIIPAMAGTAAHVTMLQRSPSYFVSLPGEDPIARVLTRLIGVERAYRLTRRKNILFQRSIYRLARRFPRAIRRVLVGDVRRRLPKGYDVERHFNPPYDPWDQRLCVVPDGDLFKAISDGGASVVTDTIERFTARGIRLASGQELTADIVIAATGLNMLALGGIEVSVDDRPVELPATTVYKSMMLSDVPNFAFTMGYSNASWTLKVDLVCDHFCRLLDHMDAHGLSTFTPVCDEPGMERLPILDLTSGYVQRRIATFPHAGDRGPWTMEMAYEQDVARLGGSVDGPALRFARAAQPEPEPLPA